MMYSAVFGEKDTTFKHKHFMPPIKQSDGDKD